MIHLNSLQGHGHTLNEYKAKNAFLDLFLKWTEENGKTIVFWLCPMPFIFVSDPNMLKSVATYLSGFIKVASLPNRFLFGQKIIGKESILRYYDFELYATLYHRV